MPVGVKFITMYSKNQITWTQCEQQVLESTMAYGTIILSSYNTFESRVNAHKKSCLNRSSDKGASIVSVKPTLFTRLICDEAHILRSAQRGDYRLILSIQFDSIFALTATPLVRSFDDLVALLQLFRYDDWDTAERQKTSVHLEALYSKRQARAVATFTDEATKATKRRQNARSQSERKEHQEKCEFFEYRERIPKQHPTEDVYVLSEKFWTSQKLSETPPSGDAEKWKKMGSKVSYILMQIMLRRALTGRLRMPPDNRFRRFLDIPHMEVTTVPVVYCDANDRLFYTAIAETIKAATSDKTEHRSSTLYLYKAGLSPVLIDTIRRTQGKPSSLWDSERPGYPDTDLLWSCNSLVEQPGPGTLLPDYHQRHGVPGMKDISNWKSTTKNEVIRRMCLGSPKLRFLSNRLTALKEHAEEKLLLWCNYPVSQWTLTLVG